MSKNKDLFLKLNDEIKKNNVDFEALREKYSISVDEWNSKYTRRKRVLEMGRVTDLLIKIGENRTQFTKDEYVDMLTLFVITLDAEKYLLDMTRAFEDFKFKEIKEKHDL